MIADLVEDAEVRPTNAAKVYFCLIYVHSQNHSGYRRGGGGPITYLYPVP